MKLDKERHFEINFNYQTTQAKLDNITPIMYPINKFIKLRAFNQKFKIA